MYHSVVQLGVVSVAARGHKFITKGVKFLKKMWCYISGSIAGNLVLTTKLKILSGHCKEYKS